MRIIGQEAPHQLVGEARFSRAARAGDAQHGDRRPLRAGLRQGFHPVFEVAGRFLVDQAQRPPFVEGQQPGQGLHRTVREPGAGSAAPVFAGGFQPRQFPLRVDLRYHGAGRHQMLDHAHQTHLVPVFGGINLGHPIGLQFRHLPGHDGAAPPAEHLHRSRAALAQQVHHVGEELHVSALVGTDRDALHVFLDGGVHDLAHRAVVPQMDHLGALALDNAPHHVDGRVVPVEEAGGRDDADGNRGGALLRRVFRNRLGHWFTLFMFSLRDGSAWLRVTPPPAPAFANRFHGLLAEGHGRHRNLCSSTGSPH